MKRLVFLLEEPSAREMLKGILPRLLPDDVHPEYKIFEGKQDMEKNLIRVLRAWRTPDTLAFVVLRDQDAADCRDVKKGLLTKCQQAKRTDITVLIRIACRELESFYLGDLSAVEKGLELTGLGRQQTKNKYRNPDALGNPAQELSRLTSKSYQKVSGSRAIGPNLDITGSNCSHSFNVLIEGIRKLSAETG